MVCNFVYFCAWKIISSFPGNSFFCLQFEQNIFLLIFITFSFNVQNLRKSSNNPGFSACFLHSKRVIEIVKVKLIKRSKMDNGFLLYWRMCAFFILRFFKPFMKLERIRRYPIRFFQIDSQCLYTERTVFTILQKRNIKNKPYFSFPTIIQFSYMIEHY